VRVQWLLDLVFAVGLGGVVRALVESFELIVVAGSRDAEGTVGGAWKGEDSP